MFKKITAIILALTIALIAVCLPSSAETFTEGPSAADREVLSTLRVSPAGEEGKRFLEFESEGGAFTLSPKNEPPVTGGTSNVYLYLIILLSALTLKKRKE